jgi:glucose-1-phosphate cytidylyltransferase
MNPLADVNVVILAGGLGTRLSEETVLKPKPMVEIGNRPILWHIQKIYSAFGCRRFLIACGYKQEIIKEYYRHFLFTNSDWVVDLASGELNILSSECPDWSVGAIDTGLNTLTGGRVRRLRPFLDKTFMLTYGDGVGNVNIQALWDFHKLHGKLATLTIVRPPARFGSVVLDGTRVVEFSEKAPASEGWINGGFFVFEPGVIDYIEGDDVSLEAVVLKRLAEDGELRAFAHEGFWQPMDTLREKHFLESLWASGKAPWKVW